MIEKARVKATLDVLLKDSVALSAMLTEGGRKQLTKALMERALEAKMQEHLG